jgi:hypothetical protein
MKIPFSYILIFFLFLLLGCTLSKDDNTLVAGQIKLISPPTGSSDLSLIVDLKWEHVLSMEQYHVLVSKNTTFTDIVLDKFQYDNDIRCFLDPNTKYYWKVGEDAQPGYAYYNWSEVWNFTTGSGNQRNE